MCNNFNNDNCNQTLDLCNPCRPETNGFDIFPACGDKVKSKAFVELEVCGRKQVIPSNEVEANKVKLVVCEEQSCSCVLAGGQIEYKVRILNDCDVDLCDCEFRDVISNCARFDRDSFRVNGRKERATISGRVICYRIPFLKKHDEMIITFCVTVM